MTSEEALLEQIKVLPPDLKREAIHFVEFLQTKVNTKTPRRSLKGALADLDIKVTDDDIRQARWELSAALMRVMKKQRKRNRLPGN